MPSASITPMRGAGLLAFVLLVLVASCLPATSAAGTSVTAREFDYVKGALSYSLPSWSLFFTLDDLAKTGEIYTVHDAQFRFTISLGSAVPIYHPTCGHPWVLQMEVIAGGNLTECPECLNDLRGVLNKWYKCNRDAVQQEAIDLKGAADVFTTAVSTTQSNCAYSYLGYAQSTDTVVYAFTSSCKGSVGTCCVNDGEVQSKSTTKGRNTFTFKAQNFDSVDLIVCQFCDEADCQVLKAFASPVSFCKQPDCAFYLCSDTVKFLLCSHPFWMFFIVLILLLLLRWYIFAALFFVLDLIRLIFRPRKPVMDEEEHVEYRVDDTGKLKESGRTKVFKPSVRKSLFLAYLFGTSSAAAALVGGDSNVRVNEVCSPPDGVVHLGQSGFTQVSNVTTCTVANDKTECVVNMEFLLDITPIAGTCRSWTISSVKGMPVQEKTIHICVDSFEEVAPLNKLYETGTPTYTTAIAAACQGSPDPVCEKPSVGWITRASASVGWGTGCFVYSSVPVCAMTSVSFTDHASVYTFGNLGQELVLTAYLEDQSGAVTCPERKTGEEGSEGETPEGEAPEGSIVKSVHISGQFNSDDIKLPSGFKIIRKHASRSWHAAQAPDRFQTSSVTWGSFQFNDVAKKTSPAYPVASPISLSGCTGPNGGWRCTVSAPGPGTENLRLMSVNDVFKSLGVTNVKYSGEGDNPLIRHIPSSPSRFVISVATAPMTFTITKEESCPVFISHNVEGGYIGNGTSSVVRIAMKSHCNAGEVQFSVTGNCKLYNPPAFCYLWNSKESICSVPVLFTKKVSSCTITASGASTETYSFQQTLVEDHSMYEQEYTNTTVVTNPTPGGGNPMDALPWWGILLIVVGVLAIVGILVLVLYCCCCRSTSVTTVLSMMGSGNKQKEF